MIVAYKLSTTTRRNTTLPTTTSLSTAPQKVIYSVGPIDLLPNDIVIASGQLALTRPMPGDVPPPDPWLWYYQSNPWEGQFAEDHNPAAVSHSIIRADEGPDDTVPEGPRLGAAGTDNILQYQHHRFVEKTGFEFVTQTLPQRHINLVAWAAHTKPNAPAGTAVKVDSNGRLAVLVLRP